MKYVILDNIRSNYNVGAIFRTADASGVGKVYLAGHTPSPIDRFGRVVGEIHKTALGAEETVLWEACSDITTLLKALKEDGFTVVAVEQSSKSVSLHEFNPPEKVAFIFGSETEGVSSEGLEGSDVILEIPMQGAKESLNVSVTVGIVLYHK